jgi:hypothetical protein
MKKYFVLIQNGITIKCRYIENDYQNSLLIVTILLMDENKFDA